MSLVSKITFTFINKKIIHYTNNTFSQILAVMKCEVYAVVNANVTSLYTLHAISLHFLTSQNFQHDFKDCDK